MWLIRFLLRFILIPLGAMTGALAAVLLLAMVSGTRFLAALGADPEAGADAVVALMIAGPAMRLAFVWATLASAMPALLAVAVAEIAAIRSWLYYAAAGGLAAWIGWWTAGARTADAIFNQPTLMAAAGIAGGLGYWLVAGWNAGFWKPVFVTPQMQQPAGSPPAG
jgi:hypothetical protein